MQLWIETEQQVRSDDRRLALFYLANDIVQKSQAGHDGGLLLKEFPTAFSKIHDSIRRFSLAKYQDSVKDLLKLWADRKIYSEEYVKELQRKIEDNIKKPLPSTNPEPRLSYNIRALAIYSDKIKSDKTELAKVEGKIKEMTASPGEEGINAEDMQTQLQRFQLLMTRIRCN